jgi:hypothetical protein
MLTKQKGASPIIWVPVTFAGVGASFRRRRRSWWWRCRPSWATSGPRSPAAYLAAPTTTSRTSGAPARSESSAPCNAPRCPPAAPTPPPTPPTSAKTPRSQTSAADSRSPLPLPHQSNKLRTIAVQAELNDLEPVT